MTFCIFFAMIKKIANDSQSVCCILIRNWVFCAQKFNHANNRNKKRTIRSRTSKNKLLCCFSSLAIIQAYLWRFRINVQFIHIFQRKNNGKIFFWGKIKNYTHSNYTNIWSYKPVKNCKQQRQIDSSTDWNLSVLNQNIQQKNIGEEVSFWYTS